VAFSIKKTNHSQQLAASFSFTSIHPQYHTRQEGRMVSQQGFTLIELMVVIAIIAMLSAIGIPAYQGYMQKAALTDMLQTMMPFKTAVELCAIDQGELTHCNSNSQGIPASIQTRYVSTVTVEAGRITLNGQQALLGLTLVMSPEKDSQNGTLTWRRHCDNPEKSTMVDACNNVFRFDEYQGVQ
jgi:prepilin peptidase dependent protein D